MAKTPILAYLKKELGFTLGEWNKLGDKDKDDLRKYADAEMTVLGIEH